VASFHAQGMYMYILSFMHSKPVSLSSNLCIAAWSAMAWCATGCGRLHHADDLPPHTRLST
jgi:hypothetical protein